MFVITAKRGKDRKIRNLYPNLFADEIVDVIGEGDVGLANLFSSETEFIGTGLFSRHSNKQFRLLSRESLEINPDYFIKVFKRAMNKRRHLWRQGCYRLINAESDFLPGIIIDRYLDVFVLQIRHPYWSEHKRLIAHVLCELFDDIRGVYERSDFESTPDAGLERASGLLCGEVPDEQIILENSLRYKISIPHGQKTGFFMDQRDNRAFVRDLIQRYSLAGKRALDLFSFTGSFSFNMADAGMYTLGVDKSGEDIRRAGENAQLNGLESKCSFLCEDVFELDDLAKEYKLIILDPPSLIKNKKEKHYGTRKFSALVKKALSFLELPGIIGLCSCAYHIGVGELEEAVRRGCEEHGCFADVIAIGIQAQDHPWMVQIPESLYLKCLWVYIDK